MPIEPIERTCAECGARRICARTKLTADTLRGDGREHLWGVCDDCARADDLGSLDAAVVRELLELPVGDEVLSHVAVDRFSDGPYRSPGKWNRDPWAHVLRAPLAAFVAEWRADRAARAGGPCTWCGMGETPPDTQWRMWTWQFRPAPTCGRCTSYFDAPGRAGGNEQSTRDAATLMLAGLVYRNKVTYRPGIGRELGLLFWVESGKKTANSVPWAHMNVPAMRRRLEAMFESGGMKRPPWWRADRMVEW